MQELSDASQKIPLAQASPATAPWGAAGKTRACAALLVLAIVAAYWNSLDCPFVFDDPLAIVENPTIRRLWPLTDVLLPPRGEGLSVEGRPVVNFSFALNYAVSGTSVRSYHVVNIAIHALAALTLFGAVRRTLLLPRLAARFGAAALPLAALTASLWALHPLQTESVTYISQRAESLVGLCYLLMLYCFVRAATCASPARGWRITAVVACLAGMATKEVMVSAPLLVLLFDRVFVAGSFRAAWRERGGFHAALFATWLLLGFLVLRTGTRGGTAGFGINVTPWQYALTQFEAVSRYVWLSFWPHPLIFDYGAIWLQRAFDVVPYALAVIALGGATIIAWRKCPAAAWLGTLFFAVLSPTSSIVPGNRQTLAEHRMYLPLAAVVVLAVCAVFLIVRGSRRGRTLLAAGLVGAFAAGILTAARNETYRSELALYRDTALKRPENGFARYNLGKVYAEMGRHAEALPEYEAALRRMADAPGVHYNVANSLVALGRHEVAVAHYEEALRRAPDYARAHFNLGNVLVTLGRKDDAAVHFRAAATTDERFFEARTNLGSVLLELGQLDEASRQFERVLQAQPDSVEAHFGLGQARLLQNRWADAVREFEAVLKLRPDLSVARERLELARRSGGL